MPRSRAKPKKGLRRKVIVVICMTTLIVMILGVGLGYIAGLNLLREVAGDVHRKLSQLLAANVTQVFDGEMVKLKGYASESIFMQGAAASNAGYETVGEAALKTQFSEMNSKWAKSDEDSGQVKEYTNNAIAARMRSICDSDPGIVQMALFNKFGSLVAASDKTNVFYISNERWRRDLFSGKPGKIFVGNIEFAETSRSWVVPVAFALKDDEGKDAGILMAELSIENLFSFLGNFKIDKSGHAALVDGRGNIIYHPGAAQVNSKIYKDKDYNRLIMSKGKHTIIYDMDIHKRSIFVSFFEITPQALLDSGKAWRILIEQNSEEIFKPLNKIVGWMVIGITFLLLVMVAVGLIFSAVLIRPIQALYAAAVQISSGDWDHPINIRTGDEVEAFADAFREMIANIKSKQAEIIKAKNELIEQSKSLEEKVRVRTIDLTAARDKLDAYSKELEKALMVKSDFVSMASHELRTPLAAIKEGIGIVLDGKTGNISDQQKEFLSMARRNVDRLARIINDILDFQKLEYGKMVMRIKENDINEIAKEACNMMAHIARDKHLELAIVLGNDIPKINCDKDKITQVLTNLISNAIRFTEKGSVTVSTCRDNNVALVSVADTGIGIKEEDMPQLFQKFSQIEKGLERKPGGTGLGLVISKEIVERHKGKIWVESKFGEGTVFHFVLPIKERRAYVKGA